MPLIEWTSDLEVKVTEIDNQHKQLVAMINELHSAMRKGEGSKNLGQLVEKLFAYAKEHFATEEKYFSLFNYPEASPHIAEHQNFVFKINEFKTGFLQGQFGLSIRVMNFLSEWLQNHIKKSDKNSAPFLMKKV